MTKSSGATREDHREQGRDGMPGYLDSASAELLHPAARATLLAALDQGFADPLALHKPG